MRSPWILILGVCLLFAAALPAAADEVPDAAALHARGKALLMKADFDGALASFAAAARAAPAVKEYAQAAFLLKRVVAQRKALDQKPQHPKWEGIAISLHAFYLHYGLHEQAIALGKRGLGVLKNSAAENRYVAALLEATQNEAALKQLTGKAAWQRDGRHGVLHGIALARVGRVKEAAAHAKAARSVKDANPRFLRDAARLESLLGRPQESAGLLVRLFEATPDRKLATLKTTLRAHPDLVAVVKHPTVVKAFETVSKVKTTSCSGGSDCGSCPSRGKCGGKK